MSVAEVMFVTLMGLLLLLGGWLWLERDAAGGPPPRVVVIAILFLLVGIAGIAGLTAAVDPLTGASASHGAQGLYGAAGVLHGVSAWLLLGRETLGQRLYLFGMPVLIIAAGLLIDYSAIFAFVGYGPLAYLLNTSSVKAWLTKVQQAGASGSARSA
jgi:hypothetical protein